MNAVDRSDFSQLTPKDQQLKRIEAMVVADLRPVRPLPPARFFLFAFAIVFLSMIAFGVTPFGMNGWGVLTTTQRIVVFGALVGGAALLGVSMIGQMVPGSRYGFAPAAPPVLILTTLLTIFGTIFRPRPERAFIDNGLTCMKSGLVYSIPAVLFFWLLVRFGALLYPKLIGAAAGGMAGLVGLSVLEINCSNLNVFHIVVWHWGVALTSIGAGILIGAAVEFAERFRKGPA
jgi:hypothetical protein